MKAKRKRPQFANVLRAKPDTKNPSQYSDEGPQNPFLGNRDRKAARKAGRPPTSGMEQIGSDASSDYFRRPRNITGDGKTLQTAPDYSITPDRITLSVRMRFNAIKGLTFERLVGYLEQWQLGFFRMAGITWDVMPRRDYALRTEVSKRRKAAARHGWQIMLEKDIPAKDEAFAEEQKRFLQKFYGLVQTTAAIDPDQRGGMRLLAYQMLDAVGVYYSAHEIIWQPLADGDLTAKFIHVPVWWLEGTHGKLRFLQSEFQVYGAEMNPGEWLITTGDGLMEASSIVYMFKNLPLRSWLQLLDRLGAGALVGKTPAQFNSPEWNNFTEALQQFAEEWAGAFSANTDISFLESKNVVGEGPFNAIIQEMNKAITVMWRGTELASRTAKDSVGAGVQQDESEIFETDDPLILEEALKDQVGAYALAWKYGPEAPRYAYLSFSGPPESNVQDDIAVDTFLSQFGVLGKESTLKRYNRPAPAEGEEILTAVAPETPDDEAANKAEQTNDAAGRVPARGVPKISPSLESASRAKLAAATHDDLSHAADKVKALLQITDPAQFVNRAKEVMAEWDEVTANALMVPKSADALASVIATAYLQGAQSAKRAEVTNAEAEKSQSLLVDSMTKHTGPEGVLTPERKSLHDKLVRGARSGVQASESPEFVLMGGGPASGKSTVVSQGLIHLPSDHVLIDSDQFKAKLPEYQEMTAAKDPRAAMFAHEESSHLAKRTMRESFGAKQNVVLDGTGNASLAGVEAKAAQAHAAGYKVRGEYVTCDTETAVARNAERGQRTGRMVPETFVRDTHRNISRIFPQAVQKGVFDEANLWDTNGAAPVLVASAKGNALTIHSLPHWNNFLAKGKA